MPPVDDGALSDAAGVKGGVVVVRGGRRLDDGGRRWGVIDDGTFVDVAVSSGVGSDLNGAAIGENDDLSGSCHSPK